MSLWITGTSRSPFSEVSPWLGFLRAEISVKDRNPWLWDLKGEWWEILEK
jgi:hypothetical protein